MEHLDFEPCRVLVVEDDPVCRRHTCEALRQAGITVKHAGSVRDGLRRALQWRPDLLLVDLHLADGGGAELARRLCAAWPGGAPPVRVAMTAADPARCGAALADAGFARVLRKPFAVSALADLVALPEGVREGRRPAPRAGARLRRLARRELARELPRMAERLECGRLDAASAEAHRLAAAAAVCGAHELGRRLQALSEACRGRALADIADHFLAARRAARDLVEGVGEGVGSG